MKRNEYWYRVILLLVAFVLGANVSIVATDFNQDGIYYNYAVDEDYNKSDTEVVVTYRGNSSNSYNNEYKGDLVIPETVVYKSKTLKVVGIDNRTFVGCPNLTSISLPKSIAYIGYDAFEDCTALKRLYITDIAAWCKIDIGGGKSNPFYYNYEAKELYVNDVLVTDLVIPEGVTAISNAAFYNWNNLTSVTLPSTLIQIGDDVFYNCTGLKSISIPHSVTTIGGYAFYNCTNLTSVTLGNSVETLKRYAFAYCEKIESIELPQTLSVIDEHAFARCKALTAIAIPDNVKKLSDSALWGCSNLTSVSLGNGITHIGLNAFRLSGIVSIDIPASVTVIDNYAFYDCANLSEVRVRATTPPTIQSHTFNDYSMPLYVPKDCSELYKKADYWKEFAFILEPNQVLIDGLLYDVSGDEARVVQCSNDSVVVVRNEVELDGVTYPVTTIASNAFGGCSELVSIVLPDNVTTVEESAFFNCINLQTVSMPHIVTIGDYAFADCPKLTTVDWGTSLASIGEYAFRDCDVLDAISMPSSLKQIEWGAFNGCLGLKKVSIADLAAWCEVELNSSSPFNNANGFYLNDTLVTNLVIPSSVEKINNYAFSNCGSLITLTIPGTVKEIGNYAFYNCVGLNEMYIEASYPPSIKSTTFKGVDESMPVYVPKTSLNLYKKTTYWKDFTMLLGADVAFNIDGLYYVVREDIEGAVDLVKSYSELDNVVIPEVVTYNGNSYKVVAIGEAAFQACSMKTITIPNSVVEIREVAFRGSGYLSEVTIPESVTYIGNGAFQSCSSLASVNLGSVAQIGLFAFRDCSNLKTIEIPSSVKSIGSSAFSGCTSLSGVYITDIAAWCDIEFSYKDSNPLSFAKRLYIDNKLVTDLVIPEGVDSIGDYAFSECNNLKTVSFPSSVVSSGYNAFEGCSDLGSVHVPDIVSWCNINFSSPMSNPMYYAKDLYVNNERLTHLVIPASVELINYYAFMYCNGIKSIVVEDGNLVYDSRENCNAIIETQDNKLIFACDKTTIPSSVAVIGSYAFSGCDGCKLSLSSNIKTIYSDAFNGASNLSVQIEEGVRDIWPAFKGCIGLVSVTIPNSVSEIEYEAFSGCTNLKSVYIAGGVTEINDRAFYNCNSLHKVTMMTEEFFDIFHYNFKYNMYQYNIANQIDTLVLPNVKEMPIDLSQFYSLKQLNIASLESMATGTFADMSDLTDLTIPFVGCGERSTATGEKGLLGALWGTYKDESMRAVTQYYATDKSKTFYVSPKLEKLTIADGCSELSYGALYGFSTLKEVTIPASVYMVGEKAFYGCAGLEHIYCQGASPAACFDNTFMGVRTATCVLHVPYKADELYARSTGWKDFYYIQAQQPISISVTLNILNAGIVLGETEYEEGDIASLQAVAHSGYRFASWVEDGVEVCNTDTYEFVVKENRNLIAVFVPIPGDNDVQTSAESNQVYFTWELEEGVDVYELTIYADADMTYVLYTLHFDAEGNVIDTRSGSYVSYMIEGLSPETNYYYQLDGRNNDGIVISQAVGSFTTTVYNAVEEVEMGRVSVYPNPATHYLIVQGATLGSVVTIYSVDGTMVRCVTVASDTEYIDVNELLPGAYIVRVGSESKRILKL